MDKIRQGTKTSTIREGHRHVPLGPLSIRATYGDCDDILVEVVAVKHTHLNEISDKEARIDGFLTVDDLRMEMENIYVLQTQMFKEISSNHPITIVSFVVPLFKQSVK